MVRHPKVPMPNSQVPNITKPKGRRWVRWLRWAGMFIVCWVTLVPSLQALWLRHRVLSDVRSAKSVRLEEFSGKQLIAKVELSVNQRQAVASALPIAPDIGVPGVISLCFRPHHRVVITSIEGVDVSFDVCFGCDEVRFGEGGIMMTPYFWQSSLRRLFTEHGVQVRQQKDYSRIKPSSVEDNPSP